MRHRVSAYSGGKSRRAGGLLVVGGGGRYGTGARELTATQISLFERIAQPANGDCVPAATTVRGGEASIICSDNGVESVRYQSFNSVRAFRRHATRRFKTVRQRRRLSFRVTCRKGRHIEEWSGAQGGGTVACFRRRGRARIEWSNMGTSVYATAVRSHGNLRRAHSWWTNNNEG